MIVIVGCLMKMQFYMVYWFINQSFRSLVIRSRHDRGWVNKEQNSGGERKSVWEAEVCGRLVCLYSNVLNISEIL